MNRYQMKDGRYADPGGTMEERYLWYFEKHAVSERMNRELVTANAGLVSENAKLIDRIWDLEHSEV